LSDERALTYCTNIHPGESWGDVLTNLADHALAVKRDVSPRRSFPLGLRLSAHAANELSVDKVQEFGVWLAEHDCRVISVNGFPYGTFHGTRVKHSVYDPDWRHAERARYTMQLADILAQWLSPTDIGSISTVPIAIRPGFADEDWPITRLHLLKVASHLARIRDGGGPLIRLALEPEPHCVLETTDDVLRFFARMEFPATLRDHIGICLDCCHQAVEFEEPEQILARLRDAGIVIAKVQVSSALRARGDEVSQLLGFDEPTYLHQAVAFTENGLARFADIPDLALWLASGGRTQECRVHFHVPVFLDHLGTVGTTRFFLERLLPRLDPGIPLEVETYSFGVLPPSLRTEHVSDSIIRELRWVTQRLSHASDSRP
jgi:hypothetical protein